MKKIETDLPGVVLLEPNVLGDDRGFFLESYHAEKFAALGIHESFVQDNHSRSLQNTVRGLHYQLKFAQAKLCRVTLGKVLDVVVDVRRGSPTFGKWAGFELSAENHRIIYVPRGFAHGFSVLSEHAEFLYKCSDFYHPEDEYGVLWNDTDIGIEWQVREPILSQKDQRNPRLKHIASERLPEYEAPVGGRGKLLSLGKHTPVLGARNRMLERAGYEVVSASSVQDAERKLKAQRFDAAIIGYTFSKKEKQLLAKLTGDGYDLPAILLYIKPGDMGIPASAHVSAVNGEAALLAAITSVLRGRVMENKARTAAPGGASREIESV